LRLTVNDNFYATYNFQFDPARFYRKPSLKRKQKNRLLADFLTPPPIETWLGALVGWVHPLLPFPVSASMLRSGFYSVLNCV
jgi:hypothetical protein